MKKIVILLCLNAVVVCAAAQRNNSLFETVDSDGNKKYILNHLEIKDYKMDQFGQTNIFQNFILSLLHINTPTDVLSLTEGKYQSMPYYLAQKLLYDYDEIPREFNLSNKLISQEGYGRLKDSIYKTKGGFYYNGIDYTSAPIEVHYKICPLGSINLDPNYYSIFIYVILYEYRMIFLNNYTMEGKLLSAIEVGSYDDFYLSSGKLHPYQRTVIDTNKKIHRVFMGGTSTCEKYTFLLDSTGYFKTLKIQVYACDYIPKALDNFSMEEVINFSAGEILKAFINDPDGYTNVREKPDISSSVLFTINKDEPFYIITDIVNDNWYAIALYQTKDKSGKIEKSYEKGYIHTSRVKIVPKE
jgi:hypothetical protein